MSVKCQQVSLEREILDRLEMKLCRRVGYSVTYRHQAKAFLCTILYPKALAVDHFWEML